MRIKGVYLSVFFRKPDQTTLVENVSINMKNATLSHLHNKLIEVVA